MEHFGIDVWLRGKGMGMCAPFGAAVQRKQRVALLWFVVSASWLVIV